MTPPRREPRKTQLAAHRVAAGVRRDDSRFRMSFALALLAHASVLAGFYSVPTRQLGDPGGLDGAISVDLATEADIEGAATVSDRGGDPMKPTIDASEAQPPVEIPLFPQPAEPPRPNEPQMSSERAPEKQSEKQSEKQPEKAQEKAAEKRSLEKTPEAKQQQAPKPQLTPLEFDLPALIADDAKKQSEQKAEPTQKQAALPREQKKAQPKPNPVAAPKLDLSLPQSAFERPTFTSGSGSAGIERPAGITRSGENDDFARGVIRALQRTMPQLSNTKGNVTVRITLDDRGNLVGTQVVRPSSIAGLDQSVVFATKQSNFPIPPKKHVQADLVFLVTYLYR